MYCLSVSHDQADVKDKSMQFKEHTILNYIGVWWTTKAYVIEMPQYNIIQIKQRVHTHENLQ